MPSSRPDWLDRVLRPLRSEDEAFRLFVRVLVVALVVIAVVEVVRAL